MVLEASSREVSPTFNEGNYNDSESSLVIGKHNKYEIMLFC